MDNEISGSGNSYTTHFRQYDSRLGRWFSLDPKKTASESPYISMGNKPIWAKDILGDTIVISVFYDGEDGDPIFQLASENLVKNQVNDGVFILIGHGSPVHMSYDKEDGAANDFYSGAAVLEYLNTDSEWQKAKKEGKPISLIMAGCNGATEPADFYGEGDYFSKSKSLVQQVSEADESITVIGADGYVQYNTVTEKSKSTNGTIGVSVGKAGIVGVRSPEEFLYDDEGNVKGTYQKKDNGGWVSYQAGKKTGKITVGMQDKSKVGKKVYDDKTYDTKSKKK
jgi:hypothetical protein